MSANTITPTFDPTWPMAEPLVLGQRSYDYYKNAAFKRLQSVTTIIKNCGWSATGLMYWANAEGLEGRNIRDARKPEADAGTLAHYYAECYSRQLRPDLTQIPDQTEKEKQLKADCLEKAQTAFLGFLDWVNREEPEWVSNELKLVSEKYQFGGTIDSFCLLKGVPTLVDFKTSKSLYPDHIMQVAAYKQLLEEHEFQIDQVIVLMMNKEDGSFMPHPIVDEKLKAGWECFELCRAMSPYKKVLDSWTAKNG